MISQLRTYRPDEAVNDLSLAFDYSADLAAMDAAENLLNETSDRLTELRAQTPPSGEGAYPLTRQ